MTPGEFGKLGNELDGTGSHIYATVPALAGQQDPIDMFDITGDQSHASFPCQSQPSPRPYWAYHPARHRKARPG